MTLRIDISKSLLELEKIHLDDSSKNSDFTLNGLYTIGLLSFPYFITVTSQQNRAETLASAIHEVSTHNFDESPSNDPVRILVIGGGFSGIAFVDKLMSFDSNKVRYEIILIEKSDRFCHLQNMCTIRRLHPHIHNWPIDGWDKETADNRISWQADSADRVAKIFRERIKQIIKNQIESSHLVEAHLSCNNIVFAKEENKFNISFSGDSFSEYESRGTLYKRNCDIVIFASGFGVEKGVAINPKDGTKGLSHSYWRNDSFGQKNLFQESETYLVSGSGDGALVDVFRLLIDDYYQDKSLNELIPLDLDLSEFKDNETTDEDASIYYAAYLKFIQTLNEMGLEPRKEHNLFYYLEHFFSDHQAVYQILWTKFQDRVKTSVKCILHITKPNRKNKIQKIVDNIDITFYNRVLFYFVYSFAELEVVVGECTHENSPEDQRNDILSIAHRYNISERNIIVRHGVYRFHPINVILTDSGFNKIDAPPPIETNEKHKAEYRRGKPVAEILV